VQNKSIADLMKKTKDLADQVAQAMGGGGGGFVDFDNDVRGEAEDHKLLNEQRAALSELYKATGTAKLPATNQFLKVCVV
jgi:hypothetical protein